MRSLKLSLTAFVILIALIMAGRSQAQFVSDSFTDANLTNLSSHTPTLGTSWVSHSSYTGIIRILNNNDIVQNSSTGPMYYMSDTPSSSDYDVQITFTPKSQPNVAGGGPCGRWSTSANTGYCFRIAANSGTYTWDILKFVSGTPTTLRTVSTTAPTLNSPVTLKLTIRTNGSNVDLVGYANSVAVATVTDSSSPILTAGKVGVRFSSNGSGGTDSTDYHWDNFSATLAGGGSVSVSPSTIPANHSGNITLTLTGTGTTWTTGTPGSPTFALTGGSGYTKVSQSVASATSATIVVSVGAVLPGGTSATGPINISDGTNSTNVTVTTPSLSISPNSGVISTTPTLTMTGVGTIWNAETAAGLFTVSGGTGASLATPTSITALGASDVLTVGSGTGALTITDTSTGATATFTAGTSSFTRTPSVLSTNHNGNIVVTLVGTGTNWTGSTTWTVSGVAGWAFVSKSFTDLTHYTVTLSCPGAATPPTSPTGTLTLTEGVTGSAAGNITIATPTLAVSPSSGSAGTGVSVTLTGTNTIWTYETAATLFSVTGGTGPTIGTPTGITNTGGTATLNTGSTAGTLTLVDNSTGASVSFTVTSTPLVAPTSGYATSGDTTITLTAGAATGGAGGYTYQWYASNTPNFTPGAGNLLSGQTSLTVTESALTNGVPRYYRIIATDTATSTAVSLQMSGVARMQLYFVFIGDSWGTTISDNSGTTTSTTRAIGGLLSSRLEALWKGTAQVTLINLCVGGTTAVYWQGGGGPLNSAMSSALGVNATPGNWYFVEHVGINDSNSGNNTSQASYQASLLSTANALVAWGAKGYFMLSPPFIEDFNSAHNATGVELLGIKYPAAQTAVAATNPSKVYAVNTKAFELMIQHPTWVGVDRVHPFPSDSNGNGGAVYLAETFARALYDTINPVGGTTVITGAKRKIQ